MSTKQIIGKVYRYCVNEIKAHQIGVAAFIFAVCVFIILIFVLKPNFPNFMETTFSNDKERGEYMIEQLVR